jgi:hypothetical protein
LILTRSTRARTSWAASDRFRSKRRQCPRDLGPCEGAGEERPPAPEIAAQGRGLRFAHRELHQRGGVKVALSALIASQAAPITRRQPTRWGPCSARSRSQGSWAGQEGLAYTLGGRILQAASSGRWCCGRLQRPARLLHQHSA